MGLFNRNRKFQAQSRYTPVANSSTIRHHADWGANGATFFVNPDGISWSYDKEHTIWDDSGLEAALAQLERAYHLNVSYPDAEDSYMAMPRMLDKTIPADAKPFFDWKPPLPGTNS